MNSNGTGHRRLTNGNIGGYSDEFPNWISDNIIFSRDISGNSDLWKMNSDGSSQTRITTHSSRDFQPTTNQDNLIVFSANRNGTGYDLWMTDINGSFYYRITNWTGNEVESDFHPDGKKVAFSWDNNTNGKEVDIWLADLSELIAGLSSPPPEPVGNVLIITNNEWKNVFASSVVEWPVIVAEGSDPNVQAFIDDYEPDMIYTLGFDLGENGSFQIDYDDVPGLFFPNNTEAVLAEDKEKGIIASLVAYYLGLPMVFDEGDWSGDLIDLTGMGLGEISEYYVGLVKSKGGNIDYIVLANLENETSLLAGRLAGMRNGYIVPVSVREIGYSGTPNQNNNDNNLSEIIGEVEEATNYLSTQGLFFNSSSHRKGDPVFMAILGDQFSVPYCSLYDPGLEVINDKDGGRLYSDFYYGDLNSDNYLDLAVGRYWGNPTGISLQIERSRLPKNEEAVLIGQYRHRTYQDLLLLGGGMTQAHAAQWILDEAGFETRRLIENRTDLPLRIGIKGMYDMAVHNYRLESNPDVGGAISFISLLWSIMEIGETMLHTYLEFEWGEWFEDFNNGVRRMPDQVEVFYANSEIGEPRILGYFGMGDYHWIIPPDKKDAAELMTVPYIRAQDYTHLDFSNFLYDDHDLSESSDIESQVLGKGGMSASSSGIVHDPYAIYFSTDFFGEVGKGKPAGEAMRIAQNKAVPENPLEFLDLFFSAGQLPNLYFKNKYERILLTDPALDLGGQGIQEVGDTFRIRPYSSYLATSGIKSEYLIHKRRLSVSNADDYLIETGKPYVPVFVREILLPKGSVVKDVDFRGMYRTYRWLKPPVVPWDEYYPEGDGFSGKWPGEKF